MSVARRVLRAAYEQVVAIGLMLVIEVSLHRTTLPATCRRLRVRLNLESEAASSTDGLILPRWVLPKLRAAEFAVSHWPAGDTCLRRCLVVGHRLRRLDPLLCIGVRRDSSGAFGAHSWLEIDGRSLDVGAVDFATLERPAR